MSKLVGLVGWRGMVGSVLMDRMVQEKDFDLIEPVFFSTSNTGGQAPAMAKHETTLQDANNIDALKRCDIIITCQGGDYTKAVYPQLRAAGHIERAAQAQVARFEHRLHQHLTHAAAGTGDHHLQGRVSGKVCAHGLGASRGG